MTEKSQFQLLKQRRFLPFFLTQFFGAFNDNVFKNALVIMIAFRVVEEQVDVLTNLAFGLFILPFFLFSAFAGQVADKFEKSVLIRRVKMGEIIIMPAHQPHALTATTQFKMMLTMIRAAQEHS